MAKKWPNPGQKTTENQAQLAKQPKIAKKPLKMAKKWPKNGQKLPKMPKFAQIGPKQGQKWPKNGQKLAKIGQKPGPEGLNSLTIYVLGVKVVADHKN